MDLNIAFTLFVILIAFIFDFINGFHDAANSIATVVTTGTLTPRQAVVWAAFFNMMAFFFFKLMVADTIGQGLIDSSLINTKFIFAALTGAIFWNLTTWYYGLPSSSSHALIGGLAGAGLATGGFAALKLTGFIKVAIGIFISPVIGCLIGLLANLLLKAWQKKAKIRGHRFFHGLQLLTSALLSLTHGGNDAQKTMGIIAILLFSSGWLGESFYIPFWVVLSCYFVISLGTLAGGFRIIDTMGKKITDLNPRKGAAVEAGAAIIIFISTECGIPVSTTHTVTGAIAGTGLSEGKNRIQWLIIKRIFLAWLLTMPAAGMVAAAIMLSI
ncbi:MAG: inorganic phosphate transporter [Proteobacteria bacterium]|nr:inorganic phosphate transporter [Pseudomonadota bacterium]